MASEPEDSFESMLNNRLYVRKPAIATNAPRKKKKVSIDNITPIDGKGPRKVAGDSSETPIVEDLKKNHIGQLRSSQSMLTTLEKYATVHSSAGTFIARVAPKLATRNWPKVGTFSTSDRKLPKKTVDYIDELWSKYWAELIITSTMEHAEGAGRALLFCEEIAPAGQESEWVLDFAPIEDAEIDYEEITTIDENGEKKKLHSGKVKRFNPHVKRGLERIQLHIDPENAVLFRAEPDPYGNKEEGIPQILGAYNTIKRVENIQDSTAKLYKRRGLGLLHMMIEGADPEDCDEYAKEYGNPDEYTVMVTDERFKVENHAGITQGYDLSETIDTYKEGLSEATGYPQSAFKGGSEGQMSTSESNSDTKETIIQTIQKRYEKYILKTLYLLDRKDKNKGLEKKRLFLIWEHTIKMDKQKEVNVKATVAGYVNSISTLLTVNEVREELGKPPIEGEEGKMIYAEYKQKFAPDPFEKQTPGEGGEEKSPNVPVPPKFEERTLKNQLNKKDALIRLYKSGVTFNEGLSILKAVSSDGKAMNRTEASQIYQKIKKGEI